MKFYKKLRNFTKKIMNFYEILQKIMIVYEILQNVHAHRLVSKY
jgi:hypothetical protein